MVMFLSEQVMVVLLSESEKLARQKQDSLSAIQRAKDAAQLLSNKKYGTFLLFLFF